MNIIMQDKSIFFPEKINLLDCKIIKAEVEMSDNFDVNKVAGYQLDNSLQLGFNLEDKLAKADFSINIQSGSNGGNEIEASACFHLIFIYRVENLEELAIPDKNNILNVNPALANALSSVTYSTSRGILITRLQGTALQNFILPIINPNNLLRSKK